MSLLLDEEHYVVNSVLNHLLRLGWRVFRQNKDTPEDVGRE
jgi:type I restriction enzyme R subunit